MKLKDDGKCYSCGTKNGDHTPECDMINVPQKCNICGTIMDQIVCNTVIDQDGMFKERKRWDPIERKWYYHDDNAEADYIFLSCPNYDEDEETCIVDGKLIDRAETC